MLVCANKKGKRLLQVTSRRKNSLEGFESSHSAHCDRMIASKFSMIVVWRRTLCDYRVPVLRPSSPKDSPFPESSSHVCEDIFLSIELVKCEPQREQTRQINH